MCTMRVLWCLMALAASCMSASIPGLGPPSTPEAMAQLQGGMAHQTQQTPVVYSPTPLQQASRGARLDLAPMSALTSAMQLFNTFSGSTTSNSGTAKSDEIPNAVFGQAAKQVRTKRAFFCLLFIISRKKLLTAHLSFRMTVFSLQHTRLLLV